MSIQVERPAPDFELEALVGKEDRVKKARPF